MDLEIQKKLQQLSRKICSLKEVYSSNTALSGLVEGCYKLGVNTTTGDVYFKNNIGEWELIPSGGNILNNVTLTQVNTLITNNQLIPTQIYKITGVEPTLYNDGTTGINTTIYLQAISTNTFAQEGTGEFYNPKYTTALDFNIWNNVSYSDSTIPTAILRPNEVITANNSATATIVVGFGNNKIFYRILTGDWTGVTSATGANGAVVNLSNNVIKSYAINAKVIYGGYVWQNLTGFVGTATNLFTLNSTNWLKIAYNEVDYTKVLDKIKYDFVSNKILRREDFFGNVVEYQPLDLIYFNTTKGLLGTPINVLQWGNNRIKSNLVTNSYLDNLNSIGLSERNVLIDQSIIAGNFLFHGGIVNSNSGIVANNLSTQCDLRNNIVAETGFISNNILRTRSSLNSNIIYSNCFMSDNVLETLSQMNSNENRKSVNSGGFAQNKLFNASQINSNQANTVNCQVYRNILNNLSKINSNIFNGTYSPSVGSDRGFIFNNTLTYSDINSNIITLVANGRSVYINANILNGDVAQDRPIRTSKINGCTLIANGNIYIRANNLQISEILNANINSVAGIQNTKLDNYIWNLNNVRIPKAVENFYLSSTRIEVNFKIVFDGTLDNGNGTGTGAGAIGTIVIPPIEAPIGYFIEEVLLDVGSGLTSSTTRDIINIGYTNTPALIQYFTGNLNNDLITRNVISNFTKSTINQNVVMSVDVDNTGAIISGTLGVIIKLTKLI